MMPHPGSPASVCQKKRQVLSSILLIFGFWKTWVWLFDRGGRSCAFCRLATPCCLFFFVFFDCSFYRSAHKWVTGSRSGLTGNSSATMTLQTSTEKKKSLHNLKSDKSVAEVIYIFFFFAVPRTGRWSEGKGQNWCFIAFKACGKDILGSVRATKPPAENSCMHEPDSGKLKRCGCGGIFLGLLVKSACD